MTKDELIKILESNELIKHQKELDEFGVKAVSEALKGVKTDSLTGAQYINVDVIDDYMAALLLLSAYNGIKELGSNDLGEFISFITATNISMISKGLERLQVEKSNWRN